MGQSLHRSADIAAKAEIAKRAEPTRKQLKKTALLFVAGAVLAYEVLASPTH